MPNREQLQAPCAWIRSPGIHLLGSEKPVCPNQSSEIQQRQRSTRLELRCPDPSCNLYLAFAVMLAAGLKGIEEKIEPPEPVEEDVYGFDDAKLAKFYIKTLPDVWGRR